MNATEKIQIIGIGDDGLDGLTAQARRLIERADLLIGDEATLALVPNAGKTRLAIGGNLEAIVDRIGAAKAGPIVVLASGDPLFYGVARYLCDRLGKDRFDVLPHVSSMQLAFARVKES
ncbi:MAG TPA: precorrin-6y C5,15-methyltransferase (decarboxylating) subunit CbiE, partial [Pirellulales bacterium]|nr:precorrin-6y C5,15-methyltransferase (decarboxylating) subunit CbiE [Pirellulales bacterium]